jgi:Flp pilus assembly protein TadG
MKKQFIVLFSLLAVAVSASAQKEYKLSKSSGQLNLNISGAIVEGYSGNEIIFSMPKAETEEVDERAKGLRAISGSGFTDNTGLGIEVAEKGGEVNVNAVNRDIKGILTIKVPQNIKISFTSKSNVYQNEIILKNLKNEIEVSTSYNKIKLENNSGPMNIKTLYGSVDAIFSDAIKGPVSIVSVYGYVDVSLPANAKANVELATSYGKLYAAEGLKIAIDKTEKDKTERNNSIATINGEPVSQINVARKITGRPLTIVTTNAANGGSSSQGAVTQVITGSAVGGLSTSYNGDVVAYGYSSMNAESIKGKINGGGADLILKSNYKNVYLREK